MRFVAAIFCLLAGSFLWAQETLPGQDLVGSDRALHRGDTGAQIVTSPDANTQIGGYAGDTSGVVTVPGIQTTGTDSRTNLQNASEAGQSSEAGAIASRHATAEILAQQRGGAGNDNGSVWNANTVRKSNLVGVTGGESQKQAARRNEAIGRVRNRRQWSRSHRRAGGRGDLPFPYDAAAASKYSRHSPAIHVGPHAGHCCRESRLASGRISPGQR